MGELFKDGGGQRRVLFLHGVVEIGGAERDLLSLLRWLDRGKWQPLVACPGTGPLVTALQTLSVPVVPIQLPAWRKLREMPRRLPACFKLTYILRRTQTALLHVNDLWWAPVARLAAQPLSLPWVVSVRQHLEPRRVRQYHLNRAPYILTLTEAAREVLLANGVPAARVRTIHSGVDPEEYSPATSGATIRAQLGIPFEAPAIGCVANVLKIKGHDILIEAFSKVVKMDPRAHCLIVGKHDSPYGAEVRALADRLGLAERTHFLGFQEDVRPFLAAMDVVVLASWSEGLPIALIEAMAMAKPVVATCVGGIPEVVEDGKTGVLVPPGDVNALAEALQTLLSDPVSRQQMGQAGRQRVVERFGLAQSVAAIHQVYKELLDRREK